MKHLLLLLTLLIPSFLWAQDDSKYLAGAVPEKNGKVVFSKDIKKDGFTKEQIFDTMLNWSKNFFNTDVAKVVFTNREKGDIAAIGSQDLVFKNTAFIFDHSIMTYRYIISCADNTCNMRVENIRYTYNVPYQEEPQKYIAENWITDNNALNVKKQKLYSAPKKFRIKTIDFVETIFAESSKALNIESENTTQQKTTKTNSQTALTSIKRVKDYTSFTVKNIPETLTKMLNESKCALLDSQSKIKESNIKWIGLGNMFGKDVATIIINKESEAYKQLGNEGLYTISFFKGNEEKPWFIIECTKQGETIEGEQVSLVGEIKDIWVK